MANYKSFDINEASTPAPWGTREEQVIKDIIDTLVVGTVNEYKDTAGHKHAGICNSTGDTVISISSGSAVSITGLSTVGSSIDLYNVSSVALTLSVDTSSDSTIYAVSNANINSGVGIYLTATSAMALTVNDSSIGLGAATGGSVNILTLSTGEVTIDSGGVYLTADYQMLLTSGETVLTVSNDVSISTVSGNITIESTSGGSIIINGLPTSSAGLTTGMLWNNSGIVSII